MTTRTTRRAATAAVLAGTATLCCPADEDVPAPAAVKPRRISRARPRNGPRIKPVVHGEDPRFDAHAVCGLQAARLFDERDTGEPLEKYRRRVAQARAVCSGCPVRAGCLEFGMTNKLNGLFGGAELEDGRVLEATGRRSA
jgi:hypothetical protein